MNTPSTVTRYVHPVVNDCLEKRDAGEQGIINIYFAGFISLFQNDLPQATAADAAEVATVGGSPKPRASNVM